MRLAPILFSSVLAAGQVRVLTYHNDNARTGQNLREYLLTPANVGSGSFGKRFAHPLDGAVYGQPLYLPSVSLAGKGLRDIVFVETSHDSVYAFDADDAAGPNAEPLWQVNFLDSPHGVTTVSSTDVSCPVIQELGITGTAVIDPASGTLYAIAETKEPGPSYVFRLHALDVATGAEKPGSPVVVSPAGFVPFEHKQRGGLLLSNGTVYTSWGSNCDLGTYHGWVIGYDAATLKQTTVFNVSPEKGGGSFWNGGGAPAADANGNVFIISGNGIYDGPNSGEDFGDSIVRLTPRTLTLADYFTPFNQSYLNLNDIDLGSSGPVLLPDDAGDSTHPHLLVAAGKEGRIYLVDRDQLGGPQFGTDLSAIASLPILGHSLFGSPAYFNGAVYIATEYSMMRSFPVASGSIASSPNSSTSFTAGALGAIPSISANGTESGIVWITPNDGALHAFDAADLSKELYNSNLNIQDALGSWVEFIVPTIAEGKAYVGTGNSLAVYGMIQASAPLPAAATGAANFDPQAIAPGGLISVFGSGLSAVTVSASEVPLPISLADVAVTIGGLRCPLLYVSPGQINVQVPYEVPAGPAKLIVTAQGAASAPLSINILEDAPAIFGIASKATSAPLTPGSYISVYVTGLGPMTSQVATGSAAPAGAVITAALPVTATIGGVPATVQFAGLAPGYPGVGQVNLQIPQLAPGTYPVVISVNGSSSNIATVVIGN